jgi:hypothetical protein
MVIILGKMDAISGAPSGVATARGHESSDPWERSRGDSMANPLTSPRIVHEDAALSSGPVAAVSGDNARHLCPSHSTVHLGFRVGHVRVLTRAEIEELLQDALAEDAS